MTHDFDDDEAAVETMLADCLEAVADDPGRFTAWEREFLEELEEVNDAFFLTDAQRDKLAQIHAERCR
jgi:hypothetical protein